MQHNSPSPPVHGSPFANLNIIDEFQNSYKLIFIAVRPAGHNSRGEPFEILLKRGKYCENGSSIRIEEGKHPRPRQQTQ